MANLTLIKRDERVQTYRNGQQVNEIDSVAYDIKDGDIVVGNAEVNNDMLYIRMNGVQGMKVNEYNELLVSIFENLKATE